MHANHYSLVSGRLVSIVWWFFCLVMISFYTGSIVMLLTTEKTIQTSIKTVDDLIKQSDIKYGTVYEGSTYDFFKVM